MVARHLRQLLTWKSKSIKSNSDNFVLGAKIKKQKNQKKKTKLLVVVVIIILQLLSICSIPVPLSKFAITLLFLFSFPFFFGSILPFLIWDLILNHHFVFLVAWSKLQEKMCVVFFFFQPPAIFSESVKKLEGAPE